MVKQNYSICIYIYIHVFIRLELVELVLLTLSCGVIICSVLDIQALRDGFVAVLEHLELQQGDAASIASAVIRRRASKILFGDDLIGG